MRVFVTGASGWIGSAVVPELLGAGHEVVGLARSDASAAALAAAGAEVRRGDLDDLDSLRAGAGRRRRRHPPRLQPRLLAGWRPPRATDLAAIEAMGAALEGTGRPFVIASGVLGLAPGGSRPSGTSPTAVHPRDRRNAQRRARLAERGVRPSVVRLPRPCTAPATTASSPCSSASPARRASPATSATAPTAGPPCTGSTPPRLFRLARGAGAGRLGAARRRRGGRRRPATSPRSSAAHLDLPVQSIPAEDAADHFGWLGRLLRRRHARPPARSPASCSAGSRPTRPDRGPRRPLRLRSGGLRGQAPKRPPRSFNSARGVTEPPGAGAPPPGSPFCSPLT